MRADAFFECVFIIRGPVALKGSLKWQRICLFNQRISCWELKRRNIFVFIKLTVSPVFIHMIRKIRDPRTVWSAARPAKVSVAEMTAFYPNIVIFKLLLVISNKNRSFFRSKLSFFDQTADFPYENDCFDANYIIYMP